MLLRKAVLLAVELAGSHLHQGLWEGALGRVIALPVHSSLLHCSALLVLVPMIVAVLMLVIMLVMLPLLGLPQHVPAGTHLLADVHKSKHSAPDGATRCTCHYRLQAAAHAGLALAVYLWMQRAGAHAQHLCACRATAAGHIVAAG